MDRLDSKNTVMVVGFNARPIACLAKQLGYRVVAVDFWGDRDIVECTDGLLTVLQQKVGGQLTGDLEKPLCELLVDLSKEAADRFEGVDFILLGSGLDDRPDLWAKLRRIAPVLGNSPERLKTIRNPLKLFAVAKGLGLSSPKTKKATSEEEAVEIAKKIGFPVVLKPISGSGGFRIRFGSGPDEVKKHFTGVAGTEGEVWVQEYVIGVDASSSIIGNGRKCVVVSVNEQLVGKKRLGVSTPFGYCGNIVPLKANQKVVQRVRKLSSALGKKLGLIGSNGFDFVIGSNNEAYLMEVNPRFQATTECIKFTTGLNLIGEHIRSCDGELPSKVPESDGCAVKMIVFARKKSVYPDLGGLTSVFDISQTGVIVDRGNPVCTIQVFAEERKRALIKAWGIVSEVYRRLEPVERTTSRADRFNS